MEWTVEGLISTVCTRYENVNLKVLPGQRLCAVRFRQQTSAVMNHRERADRVDETPVPPLFPLEPACGWH
jgi:hypothetical protein